MAESTIITPPSTPPPPPTTTTASPPTPALTDPQISLARLDTLLETYLELLDQYTVLRAQLSKQFSAGFFDLARANHTSTSRGNGRRYGDEGYDERMKAQRRVVVVAEDAEGVHDDEWQGAGAEEMSGPSEGGRGDGMAPQAGHRISIQKIKEAVKPDETSRETGSSSGATTKVKPLPSDRDPLNWYGILVPPPLRQAQASFISAVENSIPRLLNTSHAMHELETRINKYRMELGLRQGPEADLDGDETTVATPEDVNAANASSQPSRPTKEARHISTSSRKHLVQRPSEPRSRILKLDH